MRINIAHIKLSPATESKLRDIEWAKKQLANKHGYTTTGYWGYGIKM